MTTKTKAELMEELKEANITIKSLREELEEAEMLEGIHKDCGKAGRQIRAAMDAFKESGFTEEQAWELVITTMKTTGGRFQ